MKRFNAIFFVVLFFFPILTGCGEKEHPVDVYHRLRDVDRLELSRMTVGKVGMISDPVFSEANGFSGKMEALFDAMKPGVRIGVYSYDTYLVAYVDLAQLRPEDVVIDSETKTAEIHLPPVRVMTDGREPQLHEVHYRVTGMRSAITPAERAKLKSQMAAEVKKQMVGNGAATEALRESAEAKAKSWFTDLLENWGYVATVDFK